MSSFTTWHILRISFRQRDQTSIDFAHLSRNYDGSVRIYFILASWWRIHVKLIYVIAYIKLIMFSHTFTTLFYLLLSNFMSLIEYILYIHWSLLVQLSWNYNLHVIFLNATTKYYLLDFDILKCPLFTSYNYLIDQKEIYSILFVKIK